jgi:hypothetical protein
MIGLMTSPAKRQGRASPGCPRSQALRRIVIFSLEKSQLTV